MADRYFNEICPVCKDPFKEGDDIVVCPDCGAPYHRDCYAENGQCVHKEEHGTFTWQSRTKELIDQLRAREMAIIEKEEAQAENNPPQPQQTDYTNGLEMYQKRTKEAFEEMKKQGADIEGVPIDEMAAFIGKNTFYYIPTFQRFIKTNSKLSFNFSAGFLNPLQQFYRRMNIWGIIIAILTFCPASIMLLVSTGDSSMTLALSDAKNFFYQLAMTTNTLSTIIMIIIVLFNDYFYMKWCLRQINKLKTKFQGDKSGYFEALRSAGHPSLLNALLLGGGTFVVYTLLMQLLVRLV